MTNRFNEFFKNNYFEKYEFTKIEIFLLIGLSLVFVPFVASDFVDRYERFFGTNENNISKKDITDKFGDQAYEDTKILIQEYRIAEGLTSINGTKMNIAIDDHLMSDEYQNMIYGAFAITMILLILIMIFSRKGYTSYTPWLEKLANDKLKFDLLLYQHVEINRLKKFYKKTFNKENEPKPISDNQVVGWKPVDEDEKWYSVFAEKIDYRFYELGFEKLWPEWCEDNYHIEPNAKGECEPKYNRPRQLYDNPELVPDMTNEEIKSELTTSKAEIKDELKQKINDMNRKKLSEYKNLEDNEITKMEDELHKTDDKRNENNYQRKKTEAKLERLVELKEKLKSTPLEGSNFDTIIQNLDELIENSLNGEEGLKGEISKFEDRKKKFEDRKSKFESLFEEIVYDPAKKLKNIEHELDHLEKQLDQKENNTKELRIEKEKINTNIIDKLKSNLPISYDVTQLDPEIEVLEEELHKIDVTSSQISEEKKVQEEKLLKLQSKRSDFEIYCAHEKNQLERRIRKLEARYALMEDLNDEESCFDLILKEMNIFERKSDQKKSEDDEENIEIIKVKKNTKTIEDKGKDDSILHEEKIRKFLMRKIQNDVLYYAVMMNFRRGLQKATKKWLEADETLKKAEKLRIESEANQKDVGGSDLENTVLEIISTIKNDLTENNAKLKPVEIEEEENDDSAKKKNTRIQKKLLSRNEWETPEWRAMGSIYYKWREDGKKDKDKHDGKEEAEKTLSEKRDDFVNKKLKGIKRESQKDPTEVAWDDNRTIRAVHSLANSFGFPEGGRPGKAIVFFGIVFGLIISVALTNSLDIVIETLQLPEGCDEFSEIANNIISKDCFHSDFDFLKSNIAEYQYMIILLLCFFPLGILFYHQGIIFLSAKAAEELTLGNKPLIFVNFIVILLQAIIVYFLASSIGDVNSFLSLVMVLVFVDAIWVTVFTWNDMRDEVRDAPVYLEWILFDIIIGMFAWIFSIYYTAIPDTYAEDSLQTLPIFLTLLIAFTTRAAVDYSYGWKNFWSKFADAE